MDSHTPGVCGVPDSSTFRHFKRRTPVQRSWIITGTSLSSAQKGLPHAAFRGKYLEQLRAILPLNTALSTAGGPSGAACSPVPSTADHTDVLGAMPRPPRRRRRPVWVMDLPVQIAPRLTEQDPRMAAGAMVFECRPALLSVSLDVSGIDMPAVRSSVPSAKMSSLPNVSSLSRGGGRFA